MLEITNLSMTSLRQTTATHRIIFESNTNILFPDTEKLHRNEHALG